MLSFQILAFILIGPGFALLMQQEPWYCFYRDEFRLTTEPPKLGALFSFHDLLSEVRALLTQGTHDRKADPEILPSM
jgi:hypothetical protein